MFDSSRVACPHCGASSIVRWRAAGATALRPVRCPQCDGLGHVSSWTHFVQSLVLDAGLWGGIVLAVVMQSWLPLLLCPVGIGAMVFFRGRIVLLATDRAAVGRAWRKLAIEAVALLVLGLICMRWFSPDI